MNQPATTRRGGGGVRKHHLRRFSAAALALAILGASAAEIDAAANLRAAIGSLRDRIVVVDPGHGGIDPGAVGPYGHREDEIVTPISEDLAKLLERAGAIVILTRRRGWLNRRLPVSERIDRLRAAGGEVLVSIHSNQFFLAAEHGATVIYSPKSEPSRQLARMIQDEFIAITRETRRPLLSRDNLYLLNHSPVPAVIVEVGFLSNAREAGLLAQQAYQQRLAWAMFVGLARWFATRIEPSPPRQAAHAGKSDFAP